MTEIMRAMHAMHAMDSVAGTTTEVVTATRGRRPFGTPRPAVGLIPTERPPGAGPNPDPDEVRVHPRC